MPTQPLDLLAHIGQLALRGQLPADRAELGRVLREAGFSDSVIDAGLQSVTGREALPSDRAVPVHHFSDEATRFLNALRDLGYVDESMEEEVLDALLADGSHRVELADVRRQVAAVLFDRRGELDKETQQYLDEEWRLAFH
jgi:uncharacterized protein Smg (DUF494 family)